MTNRLSGRESNVNKRRLETLLACAILASLPTLVHADHDEDNWFITTNFSLGYEVGFFPYNPYSCGDLQPGDDRNYLPDPIASDMLNALDDGGVGAPGDPPGYHPGYVNLGFKAPDFDGNEAPGGSLQVQVYDCAVGSPHEDPDVENDDCDNGAASADLIKMPATVYCGAMERFTRQVMGHELFHHVQYAYIDFDNWPAWGRSAVEGSARMMEDQVYADIDGDPAQWFAGEVGKYFADPNRDWWLREYETAAGWKYMAEQYGNTTDEPQVGVDFIRRFWERAEQATDNDSIDFPATLKKTIQEFSPGTGLRDWFRDFAVANVAREFDMSLLPDADKYRYIDESDGNGIRFTPVDREWTVTLPDFVVGITDLARWGAVYTEATLTSSCQSERFIVGWRSTGDHKGYAVLAIDEDGRARQLVQGSGKDNAVSFIQRGGQETYERLVAVLIGGDEYGTVEWQYDCGVADILIRRPDSEYLAYVGPPESPTTFIVRMVVSGPDSLGDPTVLGLQPGDFSVYVGNNFNFDDEAVVVTGLYVQGEYWLVVRAPDKQNENTYPLHVNFGAISRTVQNTVSYEQRIYDQMLTVDTSGSMASPQASPSLDAAVNAASLFANLSRPGDKIGLVSFAGDDVEPNDDATLLVGMNDATDDQRDLMIARLNAMSANGFTSIGDGLEKSLFEILNNGSALGENWIVLLSDGMENEALTWEDVEPTINNWGMRVNAIALGPDADQVLLQEIAGKTKGDYYYVDTGSLRRQAAAGSVANRLADVYAASSERIKNHERLWETTGSAAPGDTNRHTIEVEEGGIQEATFSVNWDNAAVGGEITVKRPDGSDVIDGQGGARVYKSTTHTTVHVSTLTPGTWTVDVRGEDADINYIVVLAGNDTQGAQLSLHFGQYIDDPFAQDLGGLFLRGLEQPIRAVLFDRYIGQGGVITGASVRAEVEHPDGSVIDLPLYDDGEHDDGFPNDGVYGNAYARTTFFSQTNLPDVPQVGVRGSYNVVLRASGKDNTGATFNRIRKGAFNILETFDPFPDSDFDGMPDRYEDLHGCIDALSDDSLDDGDFDRLDNVSEYEAGTDPCNADTDFGGESDFSELARGANPFDPADDALPRPRDPEVVDWQLNHLDFPGGLQHLPGANWIRYPVNTAYVNMRLLRSTNPNGPFVEVAVFDARIEGGHYFDSGLPNGTTFYYRLQAEDLNGNLSAPSHVFSGTPKAEPIPPIGGIMIDGGASTTIDTSVTLNLTASHDVTGGRLGNGHGAPQTPFSFQENLPWTLQPDPDTGLATVTVQFDDAAGNTSVVYSASIQVVNVTEVGFIAGLASLEGQAPYDGILVKVDGPSGVQPDYTTALGEYRLNGLEPGLYDFTLSYFGYESVSFTDIPVAAGDITHMEFVQLALIDSDGDGIGDASDNCTLVANADQRDTNGDGLGNVCDADINNDCAVNFGDLAEFKESFTPNPYKPDADFDGDGLVNFGDLALLKSTFFNGATPGPGPGAPGNDCF